MIIKLAWRNMWRNRRRTLIIASSVMFSSIFCILMLSLVDGSCNYIIDKTIENQTGMFQIQNPSYWEDKRVDNFLEVKPQQMKKWEESNLVSCIAPRIESFAVAWHKDKTRNISLKGISPKNEAMFSKLNERLISGKYLSENDNRVLIESKMSKIMGLSIGDSITLIGQGYQGKSAKGLFVIGGIVKATDINLDAAVVYMSLSKAQEFISMPEGVTYIAITLKRKNDVNKVITQFRQDNPKYEYKRWEDLIGNTMAGAADDKRQMMTYVYFLYVIVGFGLLSTIIMLTNERKREFGIMIALGTKRSTIITSLLTEISFTAIIAIIASIVVALPIIAYFHYFPIHLGGSMEIAMTDMGIDSILPFDFSASLFYSQAIIVALLVIVVMLYPFWKIKSMKVINSLTD